MVVALVSLTLAAPLTAATVPLPLASADSGAPAGAVVVIGIPDLVWADVTPAGTPAMWDLVRRGSAGALSVRAAASRTCPADGWLTLGAGNRAVASPRTESCEPPTRPSVLPHGGAAVVPGLARAQQANGRLSFDTSLGALATALGSAGRCTSAIGPGAALAAADSTGRVASYRPSPGPAASSMFDACALSLVAIDDLADAAGARTTRLGRVDDHVAAILTSVRAGTTVLLVGLSEAGVAPARLHVALAVGPAPRGASFAGGYLTGSPQTSPYVQLIDVAPTVLALLGVKQPASVVGQSWRPISTRDSDADRVDSLVDLAVAADVHRRLVPPFFALLIILQLALYLAAALVIRRITAAAPHRRLRSMTAGAALAFAGVPVSTFLANLVPWWRADAPALALAAIVAAVDAAIVLAAMTGPWRRRLLGPMAVVAAVTCLVLAADVMTGSRLQMFSVAGYSALVAGRFYGLGNVAFALFATGALLAATAVASSLNGRKKLAGAVVLVIGAAALAVDGAPSWGADLGGVLALTPGIAVLALAAAGRRLTLVRFVLAVLAAAGLVTAFATADYLRPAGERTHLGRFVGQVLDGGALTVIERKAEANLSLLTATPLALIVPAALAFLALVLLRPTGTGAGALSRAFEDVPLLRPGLIAVLVTAAVGFVVNDSGVVIPAMAMTLAVPLALVVGLAALPGAPQDVESAKTGTRSGSAPGAGDAASLPSDHGPRWRGSGDPRPQ